MGVDKGGLGGLKPPQSLTTNLRIMVMTKYIALQGRRQGLRKGGARHARNNFTGSYTN